MQFLKSRCSNLAAPATWASLTAFVAHLTWQAIIFYWREVPQIWPTNLNSNVRAWGNTESMVNARPKVPVPPSMNSQLQPLKSSCSFTVVLEGCGPWYLPSDARALARAKAAAIVWASCNAWFLLQSSNALACSRWTLTDICHSAVCYLWVIPNAASTMSEDRGRSLTWSDLPKEKERPHLSCPLAFAYLTIRSRLTVASSSLCPPLKKTTPATVSGTQLHQSKSPDQHHRWALPTSLLCTFMLRCCICRLQLYRADFAAAESMCSHCISCLKTLWKQSDTSPLRHDATRRHSGTLMIPRECSKCSLCNMARRDSFCFAPRHDHLELEETSFKIYILSLEFLHHASEDCHSYPLAALYAMSATYQDLWLNNWYQPTSLHLT